LIPRHLITVFVDGPQALFSRRISGRASFTCPASAERHGNAAMMPWPIFRGQGVRAQTTTPAAVPECIKRIFGELQLEIALSLQHHRMGRRGEGRFKCISRLLHVRTGSLHRHLKISMEVGEKVLWHANAVGL
jgi:hypothetical protein